jgi:hypothetical protein
MRHPIIPALGLAAALFCAAPAFADEPDTAFVRQHAVDLLEGALTPDQLTKLQLIAYQAAVAAACDGFTLDEAKFTKAFDALAPADAAKMTDDQKAYHDKHILVIYGILMGGELSAMADDVGDACVAAAETRSDPEMAGELVWQ